MTDNYFPFIRNYIFHFKNSKINLAQTGDDRKRHVAVDGPQRLVGPQHAGGHEAKTLRRRIDPARGVLLQSVNAFFQQRKIGAAVI